MAHVVGHSIYDLELDVDELRCRLMEARAEALSIGAELAEAVEQDRTADARRIAERFRDAQTEIRRLVTMLRVEEGAR